MVLARAVSDCESANLETKFVEDAVIQLLKARRVLKCSYVYGYYLEDTGYKKPIFEFMQVTFGGGVCLTQKWKSQSTQKSLSFGGKINMPRLCIYNFSQK